MSGILTGFIGKWEDLLESWRILLKFGVVGQSALSWGKRQHLCYIQHYQELLMFIIQLEVELPVIKCANYMLHNCTS